MSDDDTQRLFIEVTIGGIRVFALVDCGATHTIMSTELVNLLSSKGIKVGHQKEAFITVADGSDVPIFGTAVVPINVQQNGWVGEVLILKNTSNLLTLGMNTLRKLKLIADFYRSKVSMITSEGIKRLQTYYCNNFATPRETIKGILYSADSKSRFSSSYISVNAVDVKNFHSYRNIAKESTEIEMKFNVTDEDREKFEKDIEEWKEKFSHSPGKCNIASHKIHLKNGARPLKQRYYSVNPQTQAILHEQLQDLITQGHVVESNSAWSSPVLLTKKKTGDLRMVIDYRRLNAATEKDAYPLPHIDSILQSLSKANYISALDLRSGYHNIVLDEESRPLTAFTVPGAGLYEFTVMPFGLCNAPATFQHIMQTLFRDLINSGKVFIYLDDILVAAETLEEHNRILNEVLTKLLSAGMVINWKKSFLLQPFVEYLGHTVGQGVIMTSSSKIDAVKNFPRPTTRKQVRGFLGLSGWYRRFIQFYSDRAKPLTKLLENDSPFVWGDEQEIAFQDLKEALIQEPVLCCPDYSKPFTIYTDASGIGLGAVLVQHINGKENVIGFYSKTLTAAERNYFTTELECLAVIRAIKHFRPFLEFTKFTVITDHSALQYLQKIENPKGRLARWALYLSQYNFEIIHKKGKFLTVPDSLSRMYYNTEDEKADEKKEKLTAKISSIDLNLPRLNFRNTTDLWYINFRRKIIERPEAYSSFHVENDFIFKIAQDERTGDIRRKLVIPRDHRQSVIEQCHSRPYAPHLGFLKTYQRLQSGYYWPNLKIDVQDYVFSCKECQQYKATNMKPPGEMDPTTVVMEPGTAWSTDFIGPLPMTRRRNRYILNFVDMSSRWIEAFPCRSATAQQVVKALDEITTRHGKPSLLETDHGTHFAANLLKNRCQELQIALHFIPKHSPKTNMIERHNRTVKTSIAIFAKSDQRTWDDNLPYIIHGINTSVNDVTKYTPARLMFGRELKPMFEPFNAAAEGKLTEFDPDEYVDTTDYKMAKIYKKVVDALEKAKQRQAKYYNLRFRPLTFQEGDLCWRRNFPQSKKAEFIAAKLLPKFVGPYKIHKVLSKNQYELVTLNGKNIGRWDVENLKEFR